MSVLSGGCVCGEVRYEVSEPFVSANYCHCTRCQRRTGTGASANGRTAEGSFRIVLYSQSPDDGLPRFPESSRVQ